VSFFPNVRHKKEKDLAIWVCIGLVIATIAAFWPSIRCDYVSWDDPEFIAFNPHVQAGLSWAGVKGAFTDVVACNWHPVTMLSYNFGFQLWGFDAAFDHLFNVLLHALNVLVLFLLCRKLTGTLWRSALVAGLFALHPMRVESVSWIAERKDLLCALFWFLTIWIYSNWVNHRQWWRYGLMLFAFALALMSKPMAVTLPFVLLLLDFWPLNRADEKGRRPVLWKLVVEKIPLFAMSAALCVATFALQQSAGAMPSAERWPFALRISNGFMSYWRYIAKLIWPSKLAPLYLPSAHSSILVVAAAAVLLIFLSVAILKRAPKSYLGTGWFWFLGTLT
jgi:protein O-mannosyl-transferase